MKRACGNWHGSHRARGRRDVKAQSPRTAEVQMKAAQQKAEVEGDLKGAIEEYKKVVATAGSNRALAAEALVRMADCYQKLGDAEAQAIYERLVRDFGDQKDAVAAARTQLAGSASRRAAAALNARQMLDRPRHEFQAPNRGRRPILQLYRYRRRATFAHTRCRYRHRSSVDQYGDWFSEYSGCAGHFARRRGRRLYLVCPQGRTKSNCGWPRLPAPTVPVLRCASNERVNDGAYQIAWMPDGNELIVTRRSPDRTSQIGRLTIRMGHIAASSRSNGVSPTCSASLQMADMSPTMCPPERRDRRAILVLATDGSRETVVVKNPANDSLSVVVSGRFRSVVSERSQRRECVVDRRDAETGAPDEFSRIGKDRRGRFNRSQLRTRNALLLRAAGCRRQICTSPTWRLRAPRNRPRQ